MPRKPVVGVVGTGDDSRPAVAVARTLGELLAREGWVVLSGGRNAGVMRAVNEGAKKVPGSLTVGLLPNAAAVVAPDVDVVIVTDLNNARNNVIGLSSNVLIACGVDGPGTASEVALALKNGKPVILLGVDDLTWDFFQRMEGRLFRARTPEETVQMVRDNRFC
jgi:uncharacterized protein (TIGR00725 family)